MDYHNYGRQYHSPPITDDGRKQYTYTHQAPPEFDYSATQYSQEYQGTQDSQHPQPAHSMSAWRPEPSQQYYWTAGSTYIPPASDQASSHGPNYGAHSASQGNLAFSQGGYTQPGSSSIPVNHAAQSLSPGVPDYTRLSGNDHMSYPATSDADGSLAAQQAANIAAKTLKEKKRKQMRKDAMTALAVFGKGALTVAEAVLDGF